MPTKSFVKPLALCAALLVAAAACSSGSSATSTEAPSSTAAATTATIAAPAGLPAFYSVPDPLPAGKPGDVIKTEKVDVPGLNGTLYRVMYHSQSIRGQDIAVTGMIAVPSTPAPAGGYPVISWAHGTTGLADTCAPSINPADDVKLANGLLDQGYLVTATDYEGLGTPGRHPYIAGISEARGTLDIVRAAQQIPEASASPNYVVWGHSQGGHAAMFTSNIAASYAPELQLKGVVAGAPPSQLLLINAALQQSNYRHYILMAAAGLNAGYGDQAAPLDEVLTPAGLEAINQVDQGCSSDLGKALANTDISTLQKADPATVPAWNTLLKENDPGNFATPSAQPLLIIHGGSDEQIPTVSSALLFDQLCKIGQQTQRWVYPGQSHAGVIQPSFNDMSSWIADRFAGKPVSASAAPTGQPDVAVQQCPA